jgi:hypothetical protein
MTITSFGWVIVCDTNKNLLVVDPIKSELVMRADCSVPMHSVISDPVNHRIIVFGHEKVFWIYETSTYYQEVRSICHHKAHVAVIISAVQIPNRRIFVSCDESNLIKSWDMDTIENIQTFRVGNSAPLFGLEHLGFSGFIVRSNLIYFMMFEDNQDNYCSMLKYIQTKQNKMSLDGKVWVVPKLIFKTNTKYSLSFMVATSSEVRSFGLEDGMIDFIYEPSKVLNNLRKVTITAFCFIAIPCQAVIYGLSNGTVILNPVNVEDPVKIAVHPSSDSREAEGYIKYLIESPK